MYRAIPEVNRICSMNDRARQFRLHKEALLRISKSKKKTDPAPKFIQRKTLHGKYQKNEQERITRENAKMVTAIKYCNPVIDRVDFYEHEMDHMQQVQRMTEKPINYGYEVEHRRRPQKTFADDDIETTKPIKKHQTEQPKPTGETPEAEPTTTDNAPATENPTKFEELEKALITDEANPADEPAAQDPLPESNEPNPDPEGATEPPASEETPVDNDEEKGKLEQHTEDTANALLG